jgi:hypothetical protein
MVRCKDGRKYIHVKGYKREDGIKIKGYERSCPTTNAQSSDDVYICCLCGEEHGLGDLQDIYVKEQEKKICKECVNIIHGSDIIHGLV